MKKNRKGSVCVKVQYTEELRRRVDLGGIKLANLSQQDRDLLHMKENEECLAYWTKEKEIAIEADDHERIKRCDSVRRYILLLTYKDMPSDTDCPLLAFLDDIQEEVRGLPAVHDR